MAERPRGYASRIDVKAPRSHVWRAIIDPVILKQWFAMDARVSPRLSGGYWVKLGPKFEREAHIDVFEPERRLRLIYMPPAGLPPSDGAIVEDFLLNDDANGTVLRVLGSGVPEAEEWNMFYMLLRTGWDRALPRLKVAVERENKPAASAATSAAGKTGAGSAGAGKAGAGSVKKR